MKKFLSAFLAVMMLLAVLPVASFAEGEAPAEPEVINCVAATIAEAVAGEELVNDFTCLTENVQITEVKWFDVDAGTFCETLTFAEDTDYIVYVTATAADGYIFASDDIDVEINGESARVAVAEGGKTLTATVFIYCAPIVEPVVIDEINIDFIAPADGSPAFTDFVLDTEGVIVDDCAWYFVEEARYLDADESFEAGTYCIEVTFETDEDSKFADDVSVVINGNAADSVTVNENRTITAVAEFTCEKEDVVLPFFAKLFETVKSAFVAFVRFFGTMLGLK